MNGSIPESESAGVEGDLHVCVRGNQNQSTQMCVCVQADLNKFTHTDINP